MIPYRNRTETLSIYRRPETETGDQTGEGDRDKNQTKTKTRERHSAGLWKKKLPELLSSLTPLAERREQRCSTKEAKQMEEVAGLPVEKRTEAAAAWLASLEKRPDNVIQALCNKFGLRALQACEACKKAQEIRSAANA